MTIDAVKALLVSVDPAIRREESGSPDAEYTVWQETGRRGYHADNRYVTLSLSFDVLRYARTEDDPVAAAMDAALNACGDISYSWDTAPVPGTEYIAHTFRCTALITEA